MVMQQLPVWARVVAGGPSEAWSAAQQMQCRALRVATVGCGGENYRSSDRPGTGGSRVAVKVAVRARVACLVRRTGRSIGRRMSDCTLE